jgi:hypothetical protein
MAKKKQTRTKAPRPAGTFTKQMGSRLTERNIAWLDEQSRAAGVSRSAFLDKLLDSLRETQGKVAQSGIFDMYSSEMDRLIDQVVERRLAERRGES